jgi:hypothetical protein
MVFTALLGSSFQWWTLPFLLVPKLSPALATNFSLLTTAILNWLSACRLPLSPSTHWLVIAAGPHYIALARTAQKALLPTALLSLHACLLQPITWQLLSHCLATGAFAEPFPSNSSLLASHFCFEQICHSIIFMEKPFPSNNCLCWLYSSILSKYATVSFSWKTPLCETHTVFPHHIKI